MAKKAKEKTGFFYDNTVELVDENGNIVRVWKKEADIVKKAFERRKKQKQANSK